MPCCLLCPVRIPFVPFFLCRVKEIGWVLWLLIPLLSVGGVSSAAARSSHRYASVQAPSSQAVADRPFEMNILSGPVLEERGEQNVL